MKDKKVEPMLKGTASLGEGAARLEEGASPLKTTLGFASVKDHYTRRRHLSSPR